MATLNPNDPGHSPKKRSWENLNDTLDDLDGADDHGYHDGASSDMPSDEEIDAAFADTSPSYRCRHPLPLSKDSHVRPIAISLPTSSNPRKYRPSNNNDDGGGGDDDEDHHHTARSFTSGPSVMDASHKASTKPPSAVFAKSARARPAKMSSPATPKRSSSHDPFSDDEFDESTPPAASKERHKHATPTSGFADMNEYIDYANNTSHALSYVEWKDNQEKFGKRVMAGPDPQDASSAAPARTKSGVGRKANPQPPPRRESSSPAPLAERPSSPFTQDQEILQKWTALENLIEQYVLECIADKILFSTPVDDNSPYHVFRHLVGDDNAYYMCANPAYSSYLFQITIWNYLLKTLLSRGSSTWAVDLNKDREPPTLGQGCGLGLAIDYITTEVMFKDDKKTLANRLNFFLLRKNAVDFIYEDLVNHQNYANKVDQMCQDLLFLFTGHFQPDYAAGTAKTWVVLLKLTTDVVAAAWDLALLMRRSDGVWDAFVLEPNAPWRDDCCARASPCPSRGAAVSSASRITMCVVPGLVKHEVVPDKRRGPDGSRVRTMRRVCAKVLVDLTKEDLMPCRDNLGRTEGTDANDIATSGEP